MTGRLADSTQALDREEQPFRALNLDLDDPRDRRFADYELLERIGGGGMGVVYRARQISLDREVALKILAYDPFAVDDMLARFRSEARHAGRLQHPNIVPVFEIGTHENLHFFSMGLVRGPTLGQWLRSEKRPMLEVARLMRTVAEAVEYAHQVGILHLDLKPGNVLIDERGAPQVGDFGLAHRISEAAEGRVMAAGTPAYMAPEQAGRNARLSIRTDVWGLGAILFEMLTGEPPFVGQNNAETLRRLLDHPLDPPRMRDPSVPSDLDAICRHCLAKKPNERYASARELADDLQRYIDGRPVSVRRPGWPERVMLWARREPRAALLTGGLACTLFAGLALSVTLWRQAENHRAAAQATLFDARRQSAIEAQARGDALAAVPALVANIADAERSGSRNDAELDRLRLGALLARSPRQIARLDGGGEGRSIAIAEDGQLLLASLRNGELAALALDGAQRWRITPPFPPTAWGNSFAGRMQATPDGAYAVLYSSGSSGVARPDVSAMQRVTLADGSLATPPVTALAQSFAADGRHALLKTASGWQRWRVDPWSPDGVEFDVASRYCHLTTRGLAACAEQGFKRVVLIDAETAATLARIELPSGGEIGAWLPSNDGAWLAIGGTAGDVLLVDLRTQKTTLLSADDAVNDFGFADDLLGVSGSRGSVRLLSISSGRWLTRALASGGDRMNSVIVDPLGGWLIGNDGRVAVWPFAAKGDEPSEPLAMLRHRGALIGMNAVALHAPSGLLASYGSEGDILLTRLPQPELTLAPWLPGETERPAADLPVAGNVVSLASGDWSLPAPPNRIERSAGGAVLMAAGRALYIERSGERRTLELPSSAQTLVVHPTSELALVAWIEDEGELTMTWRILDLTHGEWRSEPVSSSGLVDGVRFGADRWAFWQGPRLFAFGMDGRPLGAMVIENTALRIADLAITGDRVLIATAAVSRLQPGTLEQWRLGTPPQLLRRIATPNAHDRVFELGERWLGTGARVAVYEGDSRSELIEFGSDWNEAAAVSADGRLAAFATRAAIHLYALDTLSPLLAPQALPLARNDVIAELAFADNALIAVSHYGTRHQISLQPDRRDLVALRAEAHDALPSRDAGPVAADRTARDSGPPPPLPVAAITQPPVPFNVAAGQRFQGSSRGLGITDSAGWPRGRMRLRGVDVDLGPALQLAPAGTALGAAVFPAEAQVDAPTGGRVHFFLGNQLIGDPAFAADFLDAAGRTLASRDVSVPPSWDGAIHDPERAHLPRADVALIVRTAESRERGGGSPQLFVYHVRLDQPPGTTTLRLRALRGAPLVLGIAGTD